MILITGASGTIGGEVSRLLSERGVEHRAASRTSAFPIDYGDPASLRAAAEGVDALLLVSPGGPDVPAHDRAVLAAAPHVRRVVKLSAIGRVGAARPHLPTEAQVRERPEWAVLKPSAFASNALRWGGDPVPNPMGDGGSGVVDPRDVAEVAVAALLGECSGELVLTGPEVLTVPEQVVVLNEITGRNWSTVDVPLERLVAGLPEANARVLAEGVELVRGGGNEVVTGTVAEVLGRPARSFATWVREVYPR
ncbi:MULTISPECIES: SDR family NAD(P)-dependent oxidoreductase [Actinosynnema]|uniref:SDR family NAD(P)-dependent oxidoreductase n=1 Tax=Actinosynnema TaxID=40566 RepID=UPI0020A3B729|nr:SDR family NAD(P)-dependent oxidoreductase [Actinosynnema pretiosum]MCP2098013.1 Uncharacterized conserved protein YbjT, contains NAD(P)-binding and DUF2867 domains [Actinosynnema pretiosum]